MPIIERRVGNVTIVRLISTVALSIVMALTLAPAAHAATFTVDIYVDGPDASPGDGVCATVDGFCSLRAAVDEANALAGPDTIFLPDRGVFYDYGVEFYGEPDADPDLDITSVITIVGISGTGTNPGVVLDGGDEARLFHVHAGGTLDLSNVSLLFASPNDDGGAIRNEGTLILHEAVIKDAFDLAGINGGGIYNAGTAILSNVSIERNSVNLSGGGIYNEAGATLTATNVFFSRNRSDQLGGGLYNAGTANLFRVTFFANQAGVNGNHFFNQPPGVINFTGTFTANESVVGTTGQVTTDTEGDGATPADPIETTVISPNPGTISIYEGSGLNGDFTIGGLIARITAPNATTAVPVTLVFLIDAEGPNAATLVVSRNGAAVPDCTGAAGTADPDPCISLRQAVGDDAEITVLASAASDWTFQPAPPPEPPALSVGDASVAEGDAGTTELVFSVTRTGDVTVPSIVDFATADGTAAAPGDYQAATGTLNFAAGDVVKTIVVQVNGDTAVEPDETIVVNLSNPGGATIANGQGVGVIENDDLAPPEPGTNMRIKGHGSIGGIGKNHFQFRAGFKKDQQLAGHVDFQEKGGKTHFRSTSIGAIRCTGGDSAIIEGMGTVDRRAVTFRVEVTGGGRKGAGDRFSITWWGGSSHSAGGDLNKGDIEIDRCEP